jgi:hypothetical protein
MSAHFVLGQVSDRKARGLQLLGGQVVKKVGLVLVGVLPLPEDGPSRDRVCSAARVVAGRDGLAPHHSRALQSVANFTFAL